ncbi:MAG: hypothetical protein H6550_15875 [Chitinophagales bacterium]|nr:hypothetical protein [Chitinophagales bacterium]
MPSTDYRTSDLTTADMVFNRLPYLDDGDAGTVSTVNSFIFEVMHDLEPCFQVGASDADRVGQETYYTVVMQSIIADVVACYLLMYRSIQNAEGTSGSTPTTRYLKRAKAGSAETEWGQFSVKDGVGMFANIDTTIAYYKTSAARRARGLGCILDVCTDCTTEESANGLYPIIVLNSCGCS